MTPVHPGEQLDHYRIDSLVARSGMASIFRGVDLATGARSPLKIPHPEMEAIPFSSTASNARRISARHSTTPAS